MTDKIKNFPQGAERRNRLNQVNFRVPCQVSERWLQFPETATPLNNGDFMVVNVMTKNSEEKDRKICELVLTKQDLLKMLEQVETIDS